MDRVGTPTLATSAIGKVVARSRPAPYAPRLLSRHPAQGTRYVEEACWAPSRSGDGLR